MLSDRRAIWLTVVLVGLLVLAETYFPFFVGDPLPLPVWFFAASLGVLVLLVAAVALLDRGITVLLGGWRPGVLMGLGWAVVILQLYLAGGGSAWLPYLWASLPFAAWVVRGDRRETEANPGAALIVLLAVLLSTDFYHRFWLLTADPSPVSLGAGAALGAAGAWILMNLPGLLSPLGSTLWKHRRRAGLALFVGIVFVSMMWLTDRNPAHWEIQSNFTGVLRKLEVPEAASPKKSPNIVLVSIDGLRRDHVTPPFPEDLELEALRKLRRESVRFPRAYSPSSWTLPAHASMMSGVLPVDHGAVAHEFSGIRSDRPLFPQYLQRFGYRTAAFTGGGYVDQRLGFRRGFDHFRQIQAPYRRFVPGIVEITSGLLSFTRYHLRVKIRDHAPDPPRPAEPVLRRAREWIRSQSDTPGPFFAFVHTNQLRDHARPFEDSLAELRAKNPDLARAFQGETRQGFDPDVPLSDREKNAFLDREPFLSDTALKRFRKRARRFYRGSDWQREAMRQVVRLYPPDLKRLVKATLANLPAEEWENLSTMNRKEAEWALGWKQIARNLRTLTEDYFRARRWLYRHELRRVDRELQTFIEFLERENLYEESIVVLVSDHGEGFSRDPFLVGHGVRKDLDWEGQLHETLLHVPLWVKLPGGRGAGTNRESLVQLTDLFPMLFRHLGLSLARWPRGVVPGNVLPDTPDEPPRERRIVRGSVIAGKSRMANLFVQDRDHKLVLNLPRRTLFAHERTPSGEKPVRLSDVPGERREALRAAFREHLKRFSTGSNPYPGAQNFRQRWVQQILKERP